MKYFFQESFGQRTHFKIKSVNSEKIRTSLRAPTEICYTINFEIAPRYNYDDILTVSNNLSGLLTGFEIIPNNLATYQEINLHANGTTPRGINAPYFLKLKDGYNVYDMTFQRYITQFLPVPYTSNCKTYKEEYGMESQAHAIDDCVIRESIREFNSLCCNTVVYLRDNSTDSNFSHLNSASNWTSTVKKTKKSLEIQRNIMKECKARYPWPDCYNQRLVPKQKKEFIFEDIKNYEFYLYAPTNHDFYTRTYPQQSLLDLIINIGSMLAFWFGLSLLHLGFTFSDAILVVFRKIVRKSNTELNLSVNKNVFHITVEPKVVNTSPANRNDRAFQQFSPDRRGRDNLSVNNRNTPRVQRKSR